MDIAFHIGANCTDGDRLLRSLLRDVDALAARGVAVPGPGRYRKLLREAIQARAQGEGAEGAREVLLDAMLDGGEAARLVLSASTFLALPARVFDNGAFYGNAATKVRALRALFPDTRIELHLGLRNPATFVPAVWSQTRGRGIEDYLGGIDPEGMRWSAVVAAIRGADPTMPLTAWCNEDTPLIWGELLSRLAGLGPEAPPLGRWDLVAAIMSPEGAERFERYMATHPGQTPVQERRVIGAFLDKYAIPDEIEEEVDLPGWDAELVDRLTRAYEEDVERVAEVEGVEFVRP